MKRIINCETDETIERELTAAEIEQQLIDEKDTAKKIELWNKSEEKLKRDAVLAKLEALGLNEDDLKALGL